MIISVFSSAPFELQDVDLLKILMISNQHLSPVKLYQKLKGDKDAQHILECQAALWISNIGHFIDSVRYRERVLKESGQRVQINACWDLPHDMKELFALR